jgi:hypothetical protein
MPNMVSNYTKKKFEDIFTFYENFGIGGFLIRKKFKSWKRRLG